MPGVKGQVQRRGVERRRQIVDAAMQLFASTGFRGTGLAAIAEAVGIAPSAIVHHFGSKEGLLEAVLVERDARLASLVAPDEMGILDATLFIAEGVERDRRLAGLFTVLQAENLEPEHPVHDFFVRRSRLVRRQLEAAVRAAIDRGELRDDIDVPAIAAESLAFMEGAQLIWLLDPAKHSLADLYRGYFTRLFESLAP